MHSSETPDRPSRRGIVTGVAWSVPVIAFSVATPAKAASQFVCPAVPANASWTAATTGTGNNAPNSWSGTGAARAFTFFQDSNSASNTFQYRLSAPLSVVAGRTYRISYAIQNQYGCSGSATTVNTNFDGFVAGQRIGGRSSQPGNANTLQTPGPCGGGFGAVQTISVDYAATTTGTIQLQMRFTTAATTGGNGDDYRITPSIVCL